MTILKKLIPKLNKLDKYLDNKLLFAKSWIFYNIRGGYKCSICGRNHLRFKNVEGEAIVSDTRMILSCYNSETVCPHCVFDAIDKVFEEGKLPVLGKCDFTGNDNVPVMRIFWGNETPNSLDIRFGAQWWNGFSASREAFKLARETFINRSSINTYIDKVLYHNAGKYITFEQPIQDIK